MATKRFVSTNKIDVPKSISKAINADRKRCVSQNEHIANMGIHFITYKEIVNEGKVRSDVLVRVKKYLSKVEKRKTA